MLKRVRGPRRDGFLILYGKTLYGTVDEVPGVCAVATQFYHVYYIPLFPIQSLIVLPVEGTEFDNEGVHGTAIDLSLKSVFFAYFRAGCFLLGVVLLIYTWAQYDVLLRDARSKISALMPAWIGLGSFAMAALSVFVTRAGFDRALEMVNEADAPVEPVYAAFGRTLPRPTKRQARPDGVSTSSGRMAIPPMDTGAPDDARTAPPRPVAQRTSSSRLRVAAVPPPDPGATVPAPPSGPGAAVSAPPAGELAATVSPVRTPSRPSGRVSRSALSPAGAPSSPSNPSSSPSSPSLRTEPLSDPLAAPPPRRTPTGRSKPITAPVAEEQDNTGWYWGLAGGAGLLFITTIALCKTMAFAPAAVATANQSQLDDHADSLASHWIFLIFLLWLFGLYLTLRCLAGLMQWKRVESALDSILTTTLGLFTSNKD